MPSVSSLDHLVLTVADLDAAVAFYSEVLGMEARSFTPEGGEPRTALHFGLQKLNLHVAGKEFEPKAQTPQPGSADLCFLSANSLKNWQVHLANHGVKVEEGPVRRTGATGPIDSLYVRDPDGNLVEIATRA
ncbi:VOC family protein [Pseudoruegeria sp. SHC-113]|uniref:VOC family protein n=1 Tax=Pseudoruegeria sp. SHC-113 TaxID=2855439 RepID=UPI0021BB3AC7|nr:VOC family protein [Pseudoruegeria sp. SHC-113]MCT8159185.1 VOC family protein [Pseudoruegeria sp. SHC-113]